MTYDLPMSYSWLVPCLFMTYHLLMTCWQLVQDLFIFFSWLVHDFFSSRSICFDDLLIQCLQLDNDFFITNLLLVTSFTWLIYSWLVHELLISCLLLAHDLTKTCSELIHQFIIFFSFLSHGFFTFFVWLIHNLFTTWYCGWFNICVSLSMSLIAKLSPSQQANPQLGAEIALFSQLWGTSIHPTPYTLHLE